MERRGDLARGSNASGSSAAAEYSHASLAGVGSAATVYMSSRATDEGGVDGAGRNESAVDHGEDVARGLSGGESGSAASAG